MTIKTLSLLAGAALSLTACGSALAQATRDEVRQIIADASFLPGYCEPLISYVAGPEPTKIIRELLSRELDDAYNGKGTPFEARRVAYAAAEVRERPVGERPAAIAPAQANPYETIVTNTTPAIVTLKFTMKVSGSSGEREFPREVSGMMIAKDGLVLVSNVMVNPASVQPMGMTTVAAEMKVLIGEDTEGVNARVIATDKELDLAWVKIDEPAASGYKAIDLAASGAPGLGAELVCVERMGKIVDRAPKAIVGRAAGTTTKPRKLFMTTGLEVYPGTPAFTTDGKLVGIVSFQLPDGDFDDTVKSDLGRLGPLLLPAENIASATKRVLEQESERPKSAGGGDTPKPAEPEKKPEGEKK